MLKDSDITLVRQSVTMRAVAQEYGYKVNRHGFAICPFHLDSNPSMKIYPGDKGYYCFVCHAGGDIFDFVQRHDNVNFDEAVRKVAGMFRITLSDGDNSVADKNASRVAEMKAKREAAVKARKSAEKRLRKLASELMYYKSVQSRFEPLSDVWCWVQDKVEHLDYRWNELFDQLSRKAS